MIDAKVKELLVAPATSAVPNRHCQANGFEPEAAADSVIESPTFRKPPVGWVTIVGAIGTGFTDSTAVELTISPAVL